MAKKLFSRGDRVSIDDYSYNIAFQGVTPLGHEWLNSRFPQPANAIGTIVDIDNDLTGAAVLVGVVLDGYPSVLIVTNTSMLKKLVCPTCGR